MTCVCCNKRLWFWQKTGCNGSWHLKCWLGFEAGYDTAYKFSVEESRIHRVKDPFTLYWERMRTQYREVSNV